MQLTSGVGTEYYHENLENGQQYRYKVRAVNSCGLGDFSDVNEFVTSACPKWEKEMVGGNEIVPAPRV